MEPTINATEWTIEQWRDFSRRDDCLNRMVSSDLRRALACAISTERERCADIVSEARHGERDADLRSLIHAIRNPKP